MVSPNCAFCFELCDLLDPIEMQRCVVCHIGLDCGLDRDKGGKGNGSLNPRQHRPRIRNITDTVNINGSSQLRFHALGAIRPPLREPPQLEDISPHLGLEERAECMLGGSTPSHFAHGTAALPHVPMSALP